MKINEAIDNSLSKLPAGEYQVYVKDRFNDNCSGVYLILSSVVNKKKYNKITEGKNVELYSIVYR